MITGAEVCGFQFSSTAGAAGGFCIKHHPDDATRTLTLASAQLGVLGALDFGHCTAQSSWCRWPWPLHSSELSVPLTLATAQLRVLSLLDLCPWTARGSRSGCPQAGAASPGCSTAALTLSGQRDRCCSQSTCSPRLASSFYCGIMILCSLPRLILYSIPFPELSRGAAHLCMLWSSSSKHLCKVKGWGATKGPRTRWSWWVLLAASCGRAGLALGVL